MPADVSLVRIKLRAFLGVVMVGRGQQLRARKLEVRIPCICLLRRLVGGQDVDVGRTQHDRGHGENRQRDENFKQGEAAPDVAAIGERSPAGHFFPSRTSVQVQGSMAMMWAAPPRRNCTRNGVEVPSAYNVTAGSVCVSTASPPTTIKLLVAWAGRKPTVSLSFTPLLFEAVTAKVFVSAPFCTTKVSALSSKLSETSCCEVKASFRASFSAFQNWSSAEAEMLPVAPASKASRARARRISSRVKAAAAAWVRCRPPASAGAANQPTGRTAATIIFSPIADIVRGAVLAVRAERPDVVAVFVVGPGETVLVRMIPGIERQLAVGKIGAVPVFGVIARGRNQGLQAVGGGRISAH